MYVPYHSFFNSLKRYLVVMIWILILFILPLIVFSSSYNSTDDDNNQFNQTGSTMSSTDNQTLKGSTTINERSLGFNPVSVNMTDSDNVTSTNSTTSTEGSMPMASFFILQDTELQRTPETRKNNETSPKADGDGWMPAWIPGYRSEGSVRFRGNTIVLTTVTLLFSLSIFCP